MYNKHRSELHLMAPNATTRDVWLKGIQILIDRQTQRSQRHLIKEEK